MKQKRLLICLLVVVGAGLPVQAGSLTTENPKATAVLRWTKICGRVVVVSPKTRMLQLTQRDGNEAVVNVDKNVQILRYYRVVDFDVLKPEDRVELRYVGNL